MTLPSWPASLPQSPVYPDGWQLQKMSSTPLETQMDSGIVRRRDLSTVRILNINFQYLMTATQLTAFDTFYNTTISRGAARFTFPALLPSNMNSTQNVTALIRGDVKAEALGSKYLVSFNLDLEVGS